MTSRLRELVTTQRILHEFNKHFKLGATACSFGKILFFGTNIIQNDKNTILTDADGKLESLIEYSPTRIRQKQSHERINDFENLLLHI